MKIAPVIVIALAISPFMAGMAHAKSSRSAADQTLYERAVKECNSWKYYPDGARVHINYKKGWFRCYTRHIRKRHSK